ncbi:GAF domain-containing protein [Roseivivax lentus]|uniref:GAF domain-containing protein n=1 Tax=Roseivivax lentus TaxID=633194 RepID=A0A1N7PV11_9RHOB|nr:LuxR C-terminal-related transcriptional regulator [Roseivivax lentus]SIT14289.1 GAF domain-containing protein [Roseivivax lentus]
MTQDALSPREIEIANAYAQGDTYGTIANRLGIAPTTVRTHLATIYRKMGVSSKLDLHARLNGTAAPAADSTDFAAVISELALSLEEALRRESAMAEVLRIISRSEGDIDAVVSAILGHALELCEAEFGILFDYHGQNRFGMTHVRGIPDTFRDWMDAQGAFDVGPQTALGRLVSTHAPVNILDVRAEEIFRSENPLRWATAHLGGARSFVAIPMLSGERLAGAFTIYRQTVRPFSEATVALAQIFADQSLIALENARLFAALKDAAGPD